MGSMTAVRYTCTRKSGKRKRDREFREGVEQHLGRQPNQALQSDGTGSPQHACRRGQKAPSETRVSAAPSAAGYTQGVRL